MIENYFLVTVWQPEHFVRCGHGLACIAAGCRAVRHLEIEPLASKDYDRGPGIFLVVV